jgi:hypothetical protein
MLQRTPFEEPFLGAACYNLMLPIEPSDLVALSMARGDTPIFASAKIDASDAYAGAARFSANMHSDIAPCSLR